MNIFEEVRKPAASKPSKMFFRCRKAIWKLSTPCH